MSLTSVQDLSFAELNLPSFLLETLSRVGYEKPSPIQQETIPALLEGHDIVGMAQTGTGKTAAFALPILAKIDVNNPNTQALVLCPTRELAIQVAEAFQTYAEGIRGFHVLPVYGGQEMGRQLQALRRGAHVVVGTPGRLLDHLSRRSLNLSTIKTLVLDEADEMLRMGFIDDVELILQQTSQDRQVALFSATMPAPIRNVAEKYLRNPIEVKIKSATSTNADIEQFYWLVQGTNKLDALTRMLEVEEFDGMIIFVRTKNSTQELADKLNARGFSAAALNGDMNQQLRTRTVEQLKNGQLDIVVATDVAARGLDVERISHVMNYDIPYDNEAYVHRIGRTGRAGRSGKAILFVAPREQRMLQSIERTTRKKITRMELPTRNDLIQRRSEQFKNTIAEALRHDKLDFFRVLMAEFCHEQECSMEDAAAAMAWLLQKDRPLEPSVKDVSVSESGYGKAPAKSRAAKSDSDDDAPAPRAARSKSAAAEKSRESYVRMAQTDIFAEEFGTEESAPVAREQSSMRDEKPRQRRERARTDDGEEVSMERFRIQVGHDQGVTPREIVGAIANEGGIEGRFIGRINIYDDYSTLDLPEGMPEDIFQTLSRTRVKGQPLALQKMSKAEAAAERGRGERTRAPRADAVPGERRFDRGSDRGNDRGGDRRFDKKPAGRSFGTDERPPRARSFDETRSDRPARPRRDDESARPASTRPPRFTNSDGGFSTRRENFSPREDFAERKPRSDRSDRFSKTDRGESAGRKPAGTFASKPGENKPRRSTPRDAFIEPTFAPKVIEEYAGKAAKDKKRGGPKVRADKDKGKRRTPSNKKT